jgi:cephalosporin hydroxylase
LSFSQNTCTGGDVLAIEDGVLEDLGMGAKYLGGPNRAITGFLKDQPDSFEVAKELCDMFGRNATYNPNGYLRKKRTS